MTLDNLVLAQAYWKRENPVENDVVFVVIGILIAVLVVYAMIKSGVGGLGGGPKHFSRAAFRRAGRGAGLGEQDIRFLEDYAKALGLVDPEFAFRNPARLDSFFKSVYRAIDKNSESESDAEERRARLFAAREALTRSAAAGKRVTSTRQLGRGIPITFIAPGEESYPTIVIAVEAEGLALEPVRDAYGEPLRFRKGTKLSCYFYSEAHQGYRFEARLAGWDRIGSKEVMVLTHSDSVSALPARSHARRETRAPCTFYRVIVTERTVKGKKQRDAKVQGIPFPGTIVDISAGGLGIQSANALDAGEYLKIEFNPDGRPQSAFAKVIRMNRHKNIGGSMHVQFVRISQRSLNAILSFVYGYGE